MVNRGVEASNGGPSLRDCKSEMLLEGAIGGKGETKEFKVRGGENSRIIVGNGTVVSQVSHNESCFGDGEGEAKGREKGGKVSESLGGNRGGGEGVDDEGNIISESKDIDAGRRHSREQGGRISLGEVVVDTVCGGDEEEGAKDRALRYTPKHLAGEAGTMSVDGDSAVLQVGRDEREEGGRTVSVDKALKDGVVVDIVEGTLYVKREKVLRDAVLKSSHSQILDALESSAGGAVREKAELALREEAT